MKIVLITFVLFNILSCDDNPVDGKPENRSPVILSLFVFPDIIGPSDSAIVICNATDPDGDTLVYDWYTDTRLKIKGASRDEPWLFHTYENSRIFYPKNVNIPIDTPWVECTVRDVKGGNDVQIIHFIVKQNIGSD